MNRETAPPEKTAGSKIRELQSLAELLNARRAEGRTVVLCHGVFDPLHIGHIKHFQQAKKFGHVLVVTVTPDRFVNKGPHRPIFTEQLRAEAIAALECTDYVAINQWPTAIETIALLRPDVFVKGSEFTQKVDQTGAVYKEEEAVKQSGGRIAYTDDITFSASNLVNKHFGVFPKEVSEYLVGFAQRFGASSVVKYLDGIRPLKILIVGETIIDEYHYCEAIGKSSKEPTLVVKSLNVEQFAGGVLAVANHLANFCQRVSLKSMLGAKNSQEAFIERNLNASVGREFHCRPDSPTIVKRRFIENYFFSKLFEVYDVNDRHLDRQDNEAICATLRGRLAEFDVVLVYDFGHEMLTPEAVRILCDEAKFLAINTQMNAGNLGYHTISKYPRADMICLTENEIRLDARDRRGDLHGMLQDLVKRLASRVGIVTRGRRGCLCCDAETGFVEIPAFAGKVVDRIGAGDAFFALSAPCVAQNAPTELVGFVGNAAGAQAVATVGHRTSIDRVGLVRHIEHLLK